MYMKARTILKWVVYNSVCGEDLGILHVYPENVKDSFSFLDFIWLQFHGVCSQTLEPGEYLYFWAEQLGHVEDDTAERAIIKPDAKVLLPDAEVFLYKLDD